MFGVPGNFQRQRSRAWGLGHGHHVGTEAVAKQRCPRAPLAAAHAVLGASAPYQTKPLSSGCGALPGTWSPRPCSRSPSAAPCADRPGPGPSLAGGCVRPCCMLCRPAGGRLPGTPAPSCKELLPAARPSRPALGCTSVLSSQLPGDTSATPLATGAHLQASLPLCKPRGWSRPQGTTTPGSCTAHPQAQWHSYQWPGTAGEPWSELPAAHAGALAFTASGWTQGPSTLRRADQRAGFMLLLTLEATYPRGRSRLERSLHSVPRARWLQPGERGGSESG